MKSKTWVPTAISCVPNQSARSAPSTLTIVLAGPSTAMRTRAMDGLAEADGAGRDDEPVPTARSGGLRGTTRGLSSSAVWVSALADAAAALGGDAGPLADGAGGFSTTAGRFSIRENPKAT